MKTNISIVSKLAIPTPRSHKTDNGILTVIAGSDTYHGALIYCLKAASRIVDLIYFASGNENMNLVLKLKSDFAEFIAIPLNRIEEKIKISDAVLIGPGLGQSPNMLKRVKKIILNYPDKKFVLDADALKAISPEKLNANHFITPHKKEFEDFFREKPTSLNAARLAAKYKCTILLKGKTDYIATPNELIENHTGNAGMTKGGTGDVLAGLAAALACKNDLWLAASAAAYLNGLAGDRLASKVSTWYNASDLVEELPKTYARCIKQLQNARTTGKKSQQKLRKKAQRAQKH